VWPGPLPFDIAQEPEQLMPFIESWGAKTVIIDSLKDVALDLSKEENGARCNHAFQSVIAAGIELYVGHHQRKATLGNEAPRALSDVYGSTWLTSGCGSVLLLWGDPGDEIIQVLHLKQPAENIGPIKIRHDHETGQTEVIEVVDLVELATEDGLTINDAAKALFETPNPNRNQHERARRRLDRLVKLGLLIRKEGGRG
jgi:hypothetical protein